MTDLGMLTTSVSCPECVCLCVLLRGQPLLPVPCLAARRQRRQTQLRGFDGPQLDPTDAEEAPSSDGNTQAA